MEGSVGKGKDGGTMVLIPKYESNKKVKKWPQRWSGVAGEIDDYRELINTRHWNRPLLYLLLFYNFTVDYCNCTCQPV